MLSLWSLLAGLGAVCGGLVLVSWLYRVFEWAFGGIPGPFPFPLLGNLPQANMNPLQTHRFLLKIRKQYGPLVRITIGFDSLVVVADVEALKQLLCSASYSSYDRADKEIERFDDFLGGGLIMERNGKKWQRDRDILKPAFHHLKLRELVSGTLDAALILADHIARDAKQGGSEGAPPGVVDVDPELYALTFDMAARIMLGSDLGAQKAPPGTVSPELNAFNYCLKYSMWRFFVPFMYFKYLPSPAEQRFQRELKLLRRAINARIDVVTQEVEAEAKQVQEGSSGEDEAAATANKEADDHSFSVLRDVLRSQRKLKQQLGEGASTTAAGTAADSAPSPLLSRHDLVQQLMTGLFAGHDTTGNMLCWALYFLAKHPTVAAEVEAEVDAVVGSGNVTADHLPHLDLCHKVCKESLRLLPSAPARSRQTTEETTIGGVTLPAGTQIAWSAYVMHHDKEQWGDDCEEFNPHRFDLKDAQGNKRKRPHTYAFIPFGSGPRRCLGEHMAYMQGKVVLATLLQRFRFQLPHKDYVATEEMTLTLRPANGVHLLVKLRQRPATTAAQHAGAGAGAGAEGGSDSTAAGAAGGSKGGGGAWGVRHRSKAV